MASLTIRKLDDTLKAYLRLRSAKNGRSVEEEVRVTLRELAEGGAEPAAAPDASSILSAVRALGTMLDGRMDKIEAAMQAHERRLRKIEASVASPSGGK